MNKMMRGVGNSIMNVLLGGRKPDSSGLVRMFETEYAKEARFAKKAGAEINDTFVRSFLDAQRT